MADDLLLKVVDVGAAAQGQVSAVALGVAPVKGNAVDAAYIVNVDGITVRCRAVRNLLGGGEFGQHVGGDVVVDIFFADLPQVGIDRDIGVVVRQGDVIGGGHTLEIAVLVESVGKAEICQVGVLGICGSLVGGGVRSLRGCCLGGLGGLRSRFGSLGGIAAGGQGSGHADSQTKGCQAMEILQFHGILLFLCKIAYFTIIHAF